MAQKFRRLIPRSTVSVAQMSLDNCLFDFGRATSVTEVDFRHPSDISPNDIETIFSNASYDYRSASIGHASIAAACLWAAWAMPAGGAFAIIFKQIALPAAGLYSCTRFVDSHIVANGAERITTLFQNGACDFILDPRSFD